MTVDFLGVTVVTFAILLVNQVGTVLARAAQLQYQKEFVLELIGLGAAQNVAILMPIGLLLGLVLAFGRLYHDSEMTAAQTCGVGVGRVAAAVWVLAVPVALLVLWLNMDLAPRAAMAEQSLRSAALRAGILAPLAPGKFRSLSGGHIVIYARTARPDGDLTDVFVNRNEGQILETTVARRAHYSISPDGQSETVTLYDGERMEGIPGGNRYRIMHFDEQIVPIRTPQMTSPPPRIDEMSTAQLLHTRDPRLLAELHWRLGLPIMTLVFAVLAVPLGRLKPRQGRYAHVWLAILAVGFYAVLAQAGRSWIERRIVPADVGLWWLHGLFLMIGIGAMVLPVIARRLRSGASR
jgi:lipopolysaccharide export system permease protein